MQLTYNKKQIISKIPKITPKIIKLSSYYSPAGATSLVVIIGENFNKFSIIKFGRFSPVVIFVSSQQLEFYIPANTIPGNYPIQVINDNLTSNVVNYNIDNASGYWLLDPRTQTISNTNSNGITIVPPIKGIPFLTSYFGVTNNIIENKNTFLSINSSSNSHIFVLQNNIPHYSYINFSYMGIYLIQINLSTLSNGLTNYSKLSLNILDFPDTTNIIQTSYSSGIWNETSFNTSFFIEIKKPNTMITFNTINSAYNINIADISSQLNRLIITQIG
jgi:hypothetical protein